MAHTTGRLCLADGWWLTLCRILPASAITAPQGARRLGKTRQSTGLQGRGYRRGRQVFLTFTTSCIGRGSIEYHQLSKFRRDILPDVDLGLVFRDSLGDRVGRFVTVQVISSSRSLPFSSQVSSLALAGSASTCMRGVSASAQLTVARTDASLLLASMGAMLWLPSSGVADSLRSELLL
jgi:hypothetical protein